jgi:hypothetical protein
MQLLFHGVRKDPVQEKIAKRTETVPTVLPMTLKKMQRKRKWFNSCRPAKKQEQQKKKFSSSKQEDKKVESNDPTCKCKDGG